jgi:hypothetical protein
MHGSMALAHKAHPNATEGHSRGFLRAVFIFDILLTACVLAQTNGGEYKSVPLRGRSHEFEEATPIGETHATQYHIASVFHGRQRDRYFHSQITNKWYKLKIKSRLFSYVRSDSGTATVSRTGIRTEY